jgi:serine/threonine protein kinase
MINQQIQNYKILSLLGEGGMAKVYLAEHLSLRNKVAIKILKEDYVQNANIRKRFLAEAISLAQMSHPNIIKVTDLIDAGDIVAFVMEYIEGQTLEAVLYKKGELTRDEIEGFLNQMILAVEYVHGQGLIHRDIKPSNFMVTKSGQIKLLDFGIAKNTNEGAVDYTKTGLMQQMGTPLYMSPEQVKNTAEITKQTDVYSLGVLLWQLVMNKKPYNSEEISLPEIQVAILKELLPLTHTIWDSIIQQATEKDPTKRSLKISYNKIVESKSLSDTEIDLAITIMETTKLKIGQKHQGGIIFYLDNSGKHGKVCTESDLGSFDWDSAMKECQNLNLNGYSDWYLPSIDELKLLYNQKHIIPGLSSYYWSSSEGDNDTAWGQLFTNGIKTKVNKVGTDDVRAVRAF